MKKVFSIITVALMALTLSSCLEAAVDNDSLGDVLTAEEIAANLDIHGITPGSNKVVIKNNNKGVGGMWDYLVGVSTAQCDTVLIPFLGEQTLTFYATCGGGQVVVKKTVQIDVIDYPLDPAWTMLAGEGTEGKSWYWNANYPSGSWGCYGAGGYGWSNLGPNWSCTGIGESNGHTTVNPSEYITFDLNGGANATLHRADGSTVKGSFAFSMTTTPEKAGVGWVGTLTLKGTSLPCGFTYYDGGESTGTYDIALFNDKEIILIEPDPGAIFCDPAWASCSTHWCFTSEK